MKPLLNLSILLLLFSSCKKESADIQNKSWSSLAPIPTARHDFGFVECNNLLYAIGGYNADGLNKVEVYNPANDSWTTKAPMPTARGYLVVATVSNKIYAIGGITGSDLNNISYITVTEEYDPASNTWTEKSPIPITAVAFNSVLGNEFISGSAINGKIYVTAGYTEGDMPTYIYDPVSDTWETGKANGKFDLEPYYSVASGNDLYVTNGNYFLQYLPSDNEWRELALPSNSQGACLASYNGNIYSIGGYDYANNNPSTLKDVEMYNIANSSWSKGPQLNTERHSAAGVIYNGKLYVAGGAQLQSNYANVPLSSLEVLSLQ